MTRKTPRRRSQKTRSERCMSMSVRWRFEFSSDRDLRVGMIDELHWRVAFLGDLSKELYVSIE